MSLRSKGSVRCSHMERPLHDQIKIESLMERSDELDMTVDTNVKVTEGRVLVRDVHLVNIH